MTHICLLNNVPDFAHVVYCKNVSMKIDLIWYYNSNNSQVNNNKQNEMFNRMEREKEKMSAGVSANIK